MCPEITWMFCEMLFLTILCPVSNVFQALCSVPVWIPTLPGGASPGVRFHGVSAGQQMSAGRTSHLSGTHSWHSFLAGDIEHPLTLKQRINMNKRCFQGGQLSVR